jgi:hypothetical protein
MIDPEPDTRESRHAHENNDTGKKVIYSALDITEEGYIGDGPDVSPLQVSGAINCDLTKLTANKMMSWCLTNLGSEGKRQICCEAW